MILSSYHCYEISDIIAESLPIFRRIPAFVELAEISIKKRHLNHKQFEVIKEALN